MAADVVGFSRMTSLDEDRTLARLRVLRTDLIDPIIASQNGRVFKRTGDGALVEFRSVVEAVRCAISVQNAMSERNVGVPLDQRIEFRIGIHLGDVVEENDGDLMGDGVNIAARLEGVSAPGAICLSEDAFRQVKGRLDLAVTDLGPTRLKNIAEPVRAYSLRVGEPVTVKTAREISRGPAMRARTPLFLGLAILILAIVAAGYLVARNPNISPVGSAPVVANAPAHLSIVVLPFTNLSGDTSQDYFADGVTENVTTELSRIKNSFVIARNTAVTFKGKVIDVKDLGRTLGVRYVLEGSAQRYQDRARVNAQLIDTETGAHIWADRFEDGFADLLKLQDRIVAQIANALRYELVDGEARRAQRAQNPDAIDLAMRGWAVNPSWATWTKEHVALMQPLFEKALQIDPNNSEALGGKAALLLWEYYHERKPNFDYADAIISLSDRAIQEDGGNESAYVSKSGILQALGRAEEALPTLDAGLRINGSSAVLHAARGTILSYLRRYDETVESIDAAMRLSPRDPQTSTWFNWRADGEIGLDRYDAALADARAAIDGGWRPFFSYLNVAICEAKLGRDDAAKSALAEARSRNPSLTIKWLKEHKPILDHTFGALRKIGLPEE